jgi:penicillin-binding protein 2
MDPHSGEVLAMASWPSFDPNRLAAGLTLEEWAALDNDPRQPLLNRATLPEAPGSLAKLLVALAAAKADKADRVIHCGPSYQIGSVTIRDWNLNRNEDLDLSRALGSSCNTSSRLRWNWARKPSRGLAWTSASG